MKKILAAVLAMGMALSLAACGSSGSAASSGSAEAASSAAGEMKLAEDGKLHMATNAAFPPYESVADGGGFEGIDIELAEAIAEKLGLELVVDDMDFSSILAAVQGGKADIAMAGMTVTDERKENVNFTDTYSTGIQVVIVPEDSDIQTVDDLANDKMIGCQDGTTGYIYCSETPENDGFGEDHVIGYQNGVVAVQALQAGKVDAVVIDSEPAKAFVASNEGLKILDTEYVTEDYAIGIAKDNDALLTAVNTALGELKADGTVDKIVSKYINTEE